MLRLLVLLTAVCVAVPGCLVSAPADLDAEADGGAVDPVDGPTDPSDDPIQEESPGDGPEPANTTEPAAEDEESPERTEWLEVSAFDYTSSTLTTDASPQNVRIEVVPYGSWEPDFTYGADGPVVMGEYPVGELHQDGLIVHHGDGLTCKVSFAVPDGYEEHGIVQVEFYNGYVWVYGEAIVDHPTMETAKECPR